MRCAALLLVLVSLSTPVRAQEGDRPALPATRHLEQVEAVQDPELPDPPPVQETARTESSARGAARAVQDVGDFVYHVAVGVAVAVLSTLILRAIL